MPEQGIDLQTVRYVIMQGHEHEILPGSLRLVRPVFTMTNDEGDGPVTCYGSYMHPLTIVFTLRDGTPVSGSYDYGVLFKHAKPAPVPEKPVTVPEPVKQEPTGPRIYVKNLRGKQGYILDVRMRSASSSDRREAQVQWFTPGTVPTWVDMALLTVITSEEVSRCPNGQTGDECGSGENQCELCLEAEDEEGDTIERSMGLR